MRFSFTMLIGVFLLVPLAFQVRPSSGNRDLARQAATATVAPAATAAPTVATTDTNGTFIAGLIIWGVIIVVVAVTAFLVWRTRPKR